MSLGEHICIYCGEKAERGQAVRLVAEEEYREWARKKGKLRRPGPQRYAHAYRVDCDESWDDVEEVDGQRLGHRDRAADSYESPLYDADDYEINSRLFGDVPTIEPDDR